MNIAIILGQSRYNILEHWAYDIGQVFKQYGHNVFYWDVIANDDYWPYEQEKKIDMIFAMNAWGVVSYHDEDNNLKHINVYSKIPHDKDRTIHMFYLVDNPIYHYHRLMLNLPNKIVLYVDESYHNITSDILNVEVSADAFLPHIGLQYKSTQAKKDIDILFTSTACYIPERNFAIDHLLQKDNYKKEISRAGFKNINEVISFINETIDCILYSFENNRYISIVEALTEVFLSKKAEVLPQNLFIELFKPIDAFIRNYSKYTMLDFVVKNDFPVTVYGEGWYDHPYADKLLGKEVIDFEQIPYLNACAKIALCVNGYTIAHGSHERFANAMINGAIPLTDGSSYYERELKGLYLTNNDKDEMQKLLSDDNYFHELSKKAMKVAGKRFSIEANALKILRFASDYRKYCQ